MPRKRNFNDVVRDAIDDLLDHGFDSEDRVAYWERRMRETAEAAMGSARVDENLLRETFVKTYREEVEKGGLIDMNEGVSLFTIKKVKPELRATLDRFMLASASKIKLNRKKAMDQTIGRFSGWATSVPKGGSKVQDKPELRETFGKALKDLPFVNRRLLIDQGAKFTSALSQVVAVGGGAIAGQWHSNWRQRNYNYRVEHKDRDQKFYLVRDSWAHKERLVKPGEEGYTDQITQAAEEPFCRCSMIWKYNLRDLPGSMLTKKGVEALAEARDKIRQMAA